LNAQADMRVAISYVFLRFELLTSKKQEQKSHWTEIHLQTFGSHPVDFIILYIFQASDVFLSSVFKY